MEEGLIKVKLNHNHYYESNRIHSLKEEAESLPKLFYCDCCRSIAKFYLLELEYMKRRQPMMIMKRRQKDKVKFTELVEVPKFWNDRYEEYYTKEFSKVAMVLLRFTLCVALGEARHTLCSVSWQETIKAQRQKKDTYAKLRVMFGSLGWRYVPQERNSVYRIYIPERLWWRLFMYVKDVFGVDGWSGNMGGKRWQQGVEFAMKVYKAVCLADRSSIVLWLDTLINHCHNCGLMLDKFNCFHCSYFNLKNLLDTKHEGDVNCLIRADGYDDCVSYKKNNCNKFILLAPSD